MSNIVYVNSLQDFVAQVTEQALTAEDFLHPNVSKGSIYRGQADSSWYLCPSLYRDGLFDQERTLISELLRVSPAEFAGLTKFDILVKMQHYGLPTRLLDMTHNPLVALYFACEEAGSGEHYGSVYAFRDMPVFWQDNYAVRLLLNYIFDFSGYKLDIGKFVHMLLKDPMVSAEWSDASKIRDIAMHFLTEVPVIAVRPSLSNLRIARQDGAFLLFGMILRKKEVSVNPGTKGRVYLELSPYPGDETGEQLWHKTTEYRIPAIRKFEILRGLEGIGITRNRLFPELQYQAAFVKEFVSRIAMSDAMNGPAK